MTPNISDGDLNALQNVSPYNDSSFSDNETIGLRFNIQPKHIAIGTILSIFPALTIFGNALVIFAVLKERYLRTVTNYFIVSLACADLLMGSMVMPFAVLLEVTKGVWPFNQTFCDIWHALDVLSSTASIMNLCMIALERYWATENPISYPNNQTKCKCFVMVAAVWILSSAISFPAVIWWRFVTTSYQPYTCIFTTDRLYLIISSIVSFYGPLIVMLVVYQRIYKTATDLVKSMNAGAKVIYKNGEHGEKMVLRIHRGNGHFNQNYHQQYHQPAQLPQAPSTSSSMQPLTSQTPTTMSTSNSVTSRPSRGSQGGGAGVQLYSDLEDDPPQHGTVPCPAQRTASVSTADQTSGSTSRRIRSKLRRFALGKRLGKFAREQKAAKTLGIVMGVFIICWLPYFVCNVVITIDKRLVSSSVFNLFTWLGYINSCVNPMIYAHSMREFRRAFIKLLCCCYMRRRQTRSGTFRMYQASNTTAVIVSPTLTAQRYKRAALTARPVSLTVSEHLCAKLPRSASDIGTQPKAHTPQF